MGPGCAPHGGGCDAAISESLSLIPRQTHIPQGWAAMCGLRWERAWSPAVPGCAHSCQVWTQWERAWSPHPPAVPGVSTAATCGLSGSEYGALTLPQCPGVPTAAVPCTSECGGEVALLGNVVVSLVICATGHFSQKWPQDLSVRALCAGWPHLTLSASVSG